MSGQLDGFGIKNLYLNILVQCGPINHAIVSQNGAIEGSLRGGGRKAYFELSE